MHTYTLTKSDLYENYFCAYKREGAFALDLILKVEINPELKVSRLNKRSNKRSNRLKKTAILRDLRGL
jgi:hypothetical protein